MSKIVDSFIFFNELDLLEIRLETLYNHVDLFIITESKQSHTGADKPLYLTENSPRFAKFKDKMRIQVVDRFPSDMHPFERERFQRESVKPLLDTELSPGDYLLFGDVDEIPTPIALSQAIKALEENRDLSVAHFAMDLFYYFMNFMEVSGNLLSYMGEYPGVKKKERKWLGSTLNRWDQSITDLTFLRDPSRKSSGVRIPKGGWHFSWIGGHDLRPQIERVGEKLSNSAHQEFNSKINRKLLRLRISLGLDLLGRRHAKFRKISDLSLLPNHVSENYSRFSHLFSDRK